MASWAIYRKLPWLQPITAFVASLPHGAKVLDVASSNGATVLRVMEVRPDLQMIASDVRDMSRFYPKSIGFRQFDATKRFPFEDGEFDAVMSKGLIEHLPLEVLDGLILELQRVLKPGGRVYIETPNVRSLFYPSLKFGLAKAGKPAGPSNFYDDVTHVRPFTLVGLYKVFLFQDFLDIRVGIFRNKLFLLASPILIPAGLLLCKRHLVLTALYHIGGWELYLTATKR